MLGRVAVLVCASFVPAFGQDEGADLRKRASDAYRGAADWLLKQQAEDGTWKTKGRDGREATSLAYTALIVSALADAPAELRPSYKATVDKAAAFIASRC